MNWLLGLIRRWVSNILIKDIIKATEIERKWISKTRKGHMKNNFKVTWSFDIKKEDPEQAAKTAMYFIQNKLNKNNFFIVENKETGEKYGVDISQDYSVNSFRLNSKKEDDK